MSAVLDGVRVPAPTGVVSPPMPVSGVSLGGPATPFTPGGMESVRVAIRADLGVSSPEGYVLDAVSFVFQQRVASDSFVTIVGMDSTRSLSVTLQLQKDSNAAKLNITYQADRARRPMHARQLYPLMRFLSQLRPPNRIGIVVNGKVLADDPVPSTYGSEIPADFVELLRRLAYVQDVTGVAFSLPDEITALDLAALVEAEQLLNGEELVGTWTDAELDVLSVEVLDVLASGPALVELDGDVSVTVAGHTIPLGTLTHTFASVQLLNGEEIQASRETERPLNAHLSPAHDNRYSRRLIAPPSRPPADPFAPVALVSASSLADGAVTTLGTRR